MLPHFFFFVRLYKLNVAYKFVYYCYYRSLRYVPPCRGKLVEPFKHFLHARAHLWFLVLELQVLMGTHLLIQLLLARLLETQWILTIMMQVLYC